MIKFTLGKKKYFSPSTNSWQEVLSSTASQTKVSSSEEPTSSMMSCRYTPSLIVWYFLLGTISWFLLYHLTTALARETWHSSKARCLYMAIFTLRGFKKWTGSSAMIILIKFEYYWRKRIKCNAFFYLWLVVLLLKRLSQQWIWFHQHLLVWLIYRSGSVFYLFVWSKEFVRIWKTNWKLHFKL